MWRCLLLAEGSKEEGRWLTLDEIVEMYQRNHIPFKREYLLASLRTLIDADIIEDKSNEYTTLNSSRIPYSGGSYAAVGAERQAPGTGAQGAERLKIAAWLPMFLISSEAR